MDSYLEDALGIVKAQAGVRHMTEEEIVSMVKTLAEGIRKASESLGVETEGEKVEIEGDAQRAIRERSVQCMECGKKFKVLTKRHLATHGLTLKEYKEKHGYKKGTSLIAKGLARERRNKMRELKLWEKRGATKEAG